VLLGHYAIADASGHKHLCTAELISVSVNFTIKHCLRFYYYMNGSEVHLLQVMTIQSYNNTVYDIILNDLTMMPKQFA